MSKLIEEKLDTAVPSQHKPLMLKTAYDYLNRLSFTVNGTSQKTMELLSSDAVIILGGSGLTNIMLTKLAVHCLMPKKYGGLRNSKIFILDAGNCTDLYQFVDFMKQYGLNTKKNLKKIMISRVFTVYQLTHFLKYELFKTISEHKINIVIIPDLLEMFLQDPEVNVDEVRFLVTEIAQILKELSIKSKVLLIISLSVNDNDKPSASILKLGNTIVEIFNKRIEIDKNKTNDKFRILIQEKQGGDYVTVKKYLSLSAEDLLTVTGR